MRGRIATTVLLLAALTTPLMAEERRPDARKLTCQQVQDLIWQRGAAVITTGQYTYERFVSARGFCETPYVPRPRRISTRDTDRCEVYACERDPFEDMFERW
ncbi:MULTISPECIES: hypothetical protein [unclassified Aminobacter]|uniref:hypothetical protein n=1 Tax=unclassified Aminobacter TaxID=2644704 RepID=UPI00046727B6|nr:MULTISPECIES: hypothetical protein [unclassified Aminobacter]TWG64753.1 hypothetical protein L610_001600000350 [Aminobacter sp. J44]TWH36742.1 hypothetical protein L611_000100002240 [Aminobacter sp. J15]